MNLALGGIPAAVQFTCIHPGETGGCVLDQTTAVAVLVAETECSINRAAIVIVVIMVAVL